MEMADQHHAFWLTYTMRNLTTEIAFYVVPRYTILWAKAPNFQPPRIFDIIGVQVYPLGSLTEILLGGSNIPFYEDWQDVTAGEKVAEEHHVDKVREGQDTVANSANNTRSGQNCRRIAQRATCTR